MLLEIDNIIFRLLEKRRKIEIKHTITFRIKHVKEWNEMEFSKRSYTSIFSKTMSEGKGREREIRKRGEAENWGA